MFLAIIVLVNQERSTYFEFPNKASKEMKKSQDLHLTLICMLMNKSIEINAIWLLLRSGFNEVV